MIKSYYDDIERQHSQIKDSVEEILTDYKSVRLYLHRKLYFMMKHNSFVFVQDVFFSRCVVPLLKKVLSEQFD